MSYGDSKTDKVDQQIDFMLGQSDDEIDVFNHRIISIDNYRGHPKLDEVVNSLPRYNRFPSR